MTGGGVGKLGTSCAMGGLCTRGASASPRKPGLSVIQHGVYSALATLLAVCLQELPWCLAAVVAMGTLARGHTLSHQRLALPLTAAGPKGTDF